MPLNSKRKPGRGVESRPIPASPSQPDGSDHATRPDGAKVSSVMLESSSMPPSDPETRASMQRLISYIARQIATDILRDGRPSSRKRT
jgi:hypothetical protein